MTRIRRRFFKSPSDVEAAFRSIGVMEEGIARMLPKASHLFVEFSSLRLVQANILKQEMLSAGGDAAVRKHTILGGEGRTDAIAFGTMDCFRRAIIGLTGQPFGVEEIASRLKGLLGPERNFGFWRIRGGNIPFGICPLIMGILNITPDSFSDGGKYQSAEKAVEKALQMEEEGADIIDIGGQSTRPGAENVTEDEEARRVIPVIEQIRRQTQIPISIDTYYDSVAEKAVDAGANIINDISALRFSPQMAKLAADRQVGLVIMHMAGEPRTMQKNPTYEDVVAEILIFLQQQVETALNAGIGADSIVVDPGIGFGKSLEHNLSILKHLNDFSTLGYPVLLGHSRKSFIGRLTGCEVEERDFASIVLSVKVAVENSADIIRIHEVSMHKRAFCFLENLD